MIPKLLRTHENMVWRLIILVGSVYLLNLQIFECEKVTSSRGQNTKVQNAFLDIHTKKSYVDKSLLIKDFVEIVTDLILLTFPPKWGKTVAVDMLRTFLQMEVDAEGKKITSPHSVFTETNLKISAQKGIISAHFQQHPVIHVSFLNMRGSTVDSILPPLARAVGSAFDRHPYMKHVFSRIIDDVSADNMTKANARYHLRIFEQIRHRTADEETLKISLHMLAETLHAHFGKKVFLFIDDYDQPVDFTLTDDPTEADNKMDFFQDLIQETFKDNIHIEKALVAGRLRVAKLNNFFGLSCVVETDMLLNHLLDYFGFTEKEVDALFVAHELSEKSAEEAKRWYKGYGISAHVNRVEIIVYNPYSIAKFLEHRSVSDYWVELQREDLIGNLFKSNVMEEAFLQFLSEESMKVNLEDLSFSSDDLLTLHEALTEPSEHVERDLFFRYLFVAGYLTLDDKFEVNEEGAHLKLPNKEMESEVTYRLLDYYKTKYRIDKCVLRRLREQFRYAQSRYDTSKFKYALEELFFAFPDFQTNPKTVDAALNVALLTLKSAQRYSETQFRKWTGVGDNGRRRPSVAAVNVELKSGVAMEIRFNESVNVALSWAGGSSKSLWNAHAVRKVRVMGVRVQPDMTVLVEPGRWEIYDGNYGKTVKSA